MGQFDVHMHEYPVGGGSLADVAGHSIAVIEMGMFVDIEPRVPPGVQSNLKISLRVDLFDGSELAIGNVLIPVRRGELHAVTD